VAHVVGTHPSHYIPLGLQGPLLQVVRSLPEEKDAPHSALRPVAGQGPVKRDSTLIPGGGGGSGEEKEYRPKVEKGASLLIAMNSVNASLLRGRAMVDTGLRSS